MRVNIEFKSKRTSLFVYDVHDVRLVGVDTSPQYKMTGRVGSPVNKVTSLIIPFDSVDWIEKEES